MLGGGLEVQHFCMGRPGGWSQSSPQLQDAAKQRHKESLFSGNLWQTLPYQEIQAVLLTSSSWGLKPPF